MLHRITELCGKVKLVSERCLLNFPSEDVKQAVRSTNLNFRKEVWVRDMSRSKQHVGGI